MNTAFTIRCLAKIGERELDQLCAVLIDCVEGGDSIGFMWPMTRAKAERFWRGVAQGIAAGDRRVFVAEDAHGTIVGTVSLVWAQPENQPHRADVAKMQVHRSARRHGIGAALLAAAEQAAIDAGRTVLVLDTASADAERLYSRGGWQRCGVIPNYALMPDGAYCDTIVFYKAVGCRPKRASNLQSTAYGLPTVSSGRGSGVRRNHLEQLARHALVNFCRMGELYRIAHERIDTRG